MVSGLGVTGEGLGQRGGTYVGEEYESAVGLKFI
jgi:hypothetical protein